MRPPRRFGPWRGVGPVRVAAVRLAAAGDPVLCAARVSLLGCRAVLIAEPVRPVSLRLLVPAMIAVGVITAARLAYQFCPGSYTMAAYTAAFAVEQAYREAQRAGPDRAPTTPPPPTNERT